MTAHEYKKYKGIRKESLRDNMTNIEVILSDLGEEATRELTIEYNPYGLEQNKKVAKMGGEVAKTARNDLENKLSKTIISNTNTLNYKYINDETLNEKR